MNLLFVARRIAVLALVGFVWMAFTSGHGLADETIQVKDAAGLHKAFESARGHSGPLNIVLADGEYKIERSLELIAARKVRISAVKGATILCGDANVEVLVIGYCDDIEVSNLTLSHDPAPSESENLNDLIRIDQSRNVRLRSCTLEFSPTDNDEVLMKPTAAVKDFLGEDILSIVSNPDKILSYKLNSRDEEGPKMLGPHEIIAEGPALTPEQSKVLIGVVLDENTYDFESAKRTFLVPKFGFKFIKGKEEVALLVDVKYRNEVMFVFKGQEKKEDCDVAKEVLQKLINEIFPDPKNSKKE